MARGSAHDPGAGWEDILKPDEELLWQGQPDDAVAWEDFEIRRALFGGVVMAFAVIWTSGVLRAAPPGLPGLLMPLVGAFFFLQGARVAGGFLWIDAWRRRNSWYSLTNQRAFIATDMLGRKKLREFPITPESPLTYVEGAPGHIWFTKEYRATKNGSQRHFIGFERVPEARKVYDLMRRIQRGTATTLHDDQPL